MIKNIKRFIKESKAKRKNFLQKLSFRKSVKILENLLSSNLLNKLIFKHKDHPLSLEKSLKHAKLAG